MQPIITTKNSHLEEVSFSIATSKGIIRGVKVGVGKQLFIGFHGFANSARYMLPLAKSLSDDSTFYAMDLPFHGESDWQHSYFNALDIAEICEKIMERENCSLFSIVGFSMGGRIGIKLLEVIPHAIDKLYLISPDGFGTRWVRHLEKIPFKFRLKLANWDKIDLTLLKFTKFLENTGAINGLPHRFFKNHLNDIDRRNRMFGSWVSLSHFSVKPRRIKRNLKGSGKEVMLIFDRKDPIISSKKAIRRVSRLKSYANLVQTDGGHKITVDAIRPLIQPNK
jgi:pimeloyl-ACP methyl ester carboxylesterase